MKNLGSHVEELAFYPKENGESQKNVITRLRDLIQNYQHRY
jgi:hypothetical protein